MSMLATLQTPPDPAPGPNPFPLPLPGWDGLAVTARVHPAAASELRRLADPGAGGLTLTVSPQEVRPVFVGADRWRTDERGRLDARGTLTRGRRCAPGSLVVVGRPWALAEGVEAPPSGRVEVSGVLHVTGRAAQRSRTIDAGTPRGPGHGSWSVRGWRCYVPGPGGLVGIPVPALPGPDDLARAAFVVVDLVPR